MSVHAKVSVHMVSVNYGWVPINTQVYVHPLFFFDKFYSRTWLYAHIVNVNPWFYVHHTNIYTGN